MADIKISELDLILGSQVSDANDRLVIVDASASSTKAITRAELFNTSPALGFRRSNILGTVSQSGGVPTGAIIERGSNPNGSYIRFADGTQICTRTFGSNASQHSWTFPVPFSLTGNDLSLSAMARSFSRGIMITENWDRSLTGVTFNLFFGDDSAASTQIHCTAIGRWF